MKKMTPTWFEHATFWSGVRRATVAPQGQMNVVVAKKIYKVNSLWIIYFRISFICIVFKC